MHYHLKNELSRKGIRVVGKNEKLESFKLERLKLESLAEVGKNRKFIISSKLGLG